MLKVLVLLVCYDCNLNIFWLLTSDQINSPSRMHIRPVKMYNFSKLCKLQDYKNAVYLCFLHPDKQDAYRALD